MHLPLIITLIITLPLDQVLQVVVAHSAVQYGLDLILFLTVDESWGWGWCRSSARDGIRMRGGQLDHREDRVDVRGHPFIFLLPLSVRATLLS
jgi:hypothetical protein